MLRRSKEDLKLKPLLMPLFKWLNKLKSRLLRLLLISRLPKLLKLPKLMLPLKRQGKRSLD